MRLLCNSFGTCAFFKKGLLERGPGLPIPRGEIRSKRIEELGVGVAATSEDAADVAPDDEGSFAAKGGTTIVTNIDRIRIDTCVLF